MLVIVDSDATLEHFGVVQDVTETKLSGHIFENHCDDFDVKGCQRECQTFLLAFLVMPWHNY